MYLHRIIAEFEEADIIANTENREDKNYEINDYKR